MASSASSSSLNENNGSRGSRILAALMQPIRLFSAIRRFLGEWLAKFKLRGDLGSAGDSKRQQGLSIGSSSVESATNFVVVEGSATRSFAPPNEVLAFFNYRSSPFYAQLDGSDDADESSKQVTGKGAERAAAPGSDANLDSDAKPLRWLQHRNAKPPTAGQLGLDRARHELLQELYDEASAAEKQQRGGGWRGL
jgi:hypothetical protein